MKSLREQTNKLIKESKVKCDTSVMYAKMKIKTLIEACEYILTAMSIELKMYIEIKESITKLKKIMEK